VRPGCQLCLENVNYHDHAGDLAGYHLQRQGEAGNLQAIIKFGMVGAVGTLCHYATLITLVELLRVGAVTATTAGFLAGMLVNYALNYRYTFRSDRPHVQAAPRFFLIGVCTGVLNALLMHLGVVVAGMNYLLIQLVTTAVLFLLNYLLNSIWTFAGSQGNERRE